MSSAKHAIEDILDGFDQLRRYPAKRDTLEIDLWYPGIAGNAKHIEVGLTDVRAADSIRIHYDFDRDGYAIEQASRFEWEADDEVRAPDWREVAFVKSWARLPPP